MKLPASPKVLAAIFVQCTLIACDKTGGPSSATPSSATSTAEANSAPAPEAKGVSGEVTVGAAPPTFTATAHDGTKIDVKAELGKRPVVVYFYPKNETPGCTKEACAFRDAWTNLGKSNVLLIGISGDTIDSHKAFAEHHKLPFHLVSDTDGAIAKQFGVPFSGGYAGRQSFVIGKGGTVKKIYRSVDVTVHAKEIEGDLQSP
jgi:peroxiredoxin Q/BCP